MINNLWVSNSYGLWEKLSIFIGVLFLALTKTNGFTPLVLTALLLIFILIIQKTPFRQLIRFLRIPLFFALFGLFSIILTLGSAENSIWVFSSKYISLSITNDSLFQTQTVAWRLLNSLLVFYTLIAYFTRDDFLKICEKTKLPIDLIELGVLSFRYINIVSQKAQEIRTAQQLRLGYTSYRISLNSFSLLLSSVFIYSSVFFKQNYQALICRGYDKQLYYPTKMHHRKDRWWLLIFIIVSYFLLLFYL